MCFEPRAVTRSQRKSLTHYNDLTEAEMVAPQMRCHSILTHVSNRNIRNLVAIVAGLSLWLVGGTG